MMKIQSKHIHKSTQLTHIQNIANYFVFFIFLVIHTKRKFDGSNKGRNSPIKLWFKFKKFQKFT